MTSFVTELAYGGTVHVLGWWRVWYVGWLWVFGYVGEALLVGIREGVAVALRLLRSTGESAAILVPIGIAVLSRSKACNCRRKRWFLDSHNLGRRLFSSVVVLLAAHVE